MDQDTDRFEALINAGLAASREGRSHDAMGLYGEASAVLPASGIPHFLMGSEHAAAGDGASAEAAFANAVLLAPEFALARYQLGLLQFSAGRASVALVTWGPLCALPESESLGHFVRGFAALAQDQFAQSLQHFETGLACPGLNPALAADIRQVIEAIQRLPPSDAASGHVLLAAYARGVH